MTMRAPRFGRFALLERIGTGGAGEVLLVDDGGRRRALKRLLPHLDGAGLGDAFAREGKLATRLEHRNVVRVYEHGRVASTPYVLMEYVDGASLHRLLRAAGCLPVGAAAFVARELCRALAYLHEVRDDDGRPLALVHRDVSPANALVSRAGDVKLCDFGITKATAAATTTGARTAPGLIKGKAGYRAPEQDGGARLDGRSDVYAVGVVLFEMIAGRRPRDDEERLTDAPAALDAICARARATAPSLRFATAAEMAAALDDAAAALDGQAELRALMTQWFPPPVAAETTRTRTLARGSGGRGRVAALAIAAVAVVAGLAFALGRRGERPAPPPAPPPVSTAVAAPAAAPAIPLPPPPIVAPATRTTPAHGKPKRPRRPATATAPATPASDYMPDPFHH